MRIATPFNALRNATSDIWRMHDFNYQLPKDQRQDYWEKEKIKPIRHIALDIFCTS